jgi:hypothetical protein
MDYFEHMRRRLDGQEQFVPSHLGRKSEVRRLAAMIGVQTPAVKAFTLPRFATATHSFVAAITADPASPGHFWAIDGARRSSSGLLAESPHPVAVSG